MSKDKGKKVATVNPEDNDVVVASKFHISDLWKVEDWWTIWIGFFIIALAIILLLPISSQAKGHSPIARRSSGLGGPLKFQV